MQETKLLHYPFFLQLFTVGADAVTRTGSVQRSAPQVKKQEHFLVSLLERHNEGIYDVGCVFPLLLKINFMKGRAAENKIEEGGRSLIFQRLNSFLFPLLPPQERSEF